MLGYLPGAVLVCWVLPWVWDGRDFPEGAGFAVMERPYQVTVTGWLVILAGVISTFVHLWRYAMDRWMFVIVLVGAIAVVAGAFLLRGSRWARWVILAWIGGHVVAFSLLGVSEGLPLAVLLVIFGYVLLGPPTAEYDRRKQSSEF